jgi:transposase
MGNVLEKSKQEQVIALGRLGWSLRRIEEATGVRRETAGGYLRSAGIALRTPGGWGHSSPAKPAIEVTTGFLPEKAPPEQAGKRSAGVSEAYREMIELELSRGRNATGIWQDMVDTHGFAGGYQSVKRLVRKLRGAVSSEARVIIETKLGEECQVDYGTGPMVRDPDSGKYRRTRLFVLTLGCSRKSVRLLVFRSSARIWAELHEKAFRRLGGSPRIAVLDNLREGVLSPDIYDPGLNPLCRDVLAHYGVTALPCKVRDPDRKGKVEAGVAHAQKTPLKGKKFESLEEAQAYLDHWEERWADKRIHGRTKRQVAAMFAEEKPYLQTLPVEPFRYYQYGERTVHLDGCVEVEAAYYGAPPGCIGRKVNVQWDSMYVRLIDPRTGQLLREHLGQKRGGHRIRDEDRPRRTPLHTHQLLARAHKAGANIGAVCDANQDRQPGRRPMTTAKAKAKTKAKTKAIGMPGKERPAASRLGIQKPLPTEPHHRNHGKNTKPSDSPSIGQAAEGLDHRFLRSQPRVIGPGSLRKARSRRSEYNLNTHPEDLNTKHDFNDSNRALQIHAVEA